MNQYMVYFGERFMWTSRKCVSCFCWGECSININQFILLDSILFISDIILCISRSSIWIFFIYSIFFFNMLMFLFTSFSIYIIVQGPYLLIPSSLSFFDLFLSIYFFSLLRVTFSCLFGSLVISYCMTNTVNFMMLSAGFCCTPLKNVGFCPGI